MNYSYSSIALACLASLGLNGCGGGGGGAPTAPATVSLSGSAVKGPVFGGQVCAYTLITPHQQIACTTTDSNSNYHLALPAGTGEVLLEVTGGTYIDEATGSKVSLDSPLRTAAKVTGGALDNILLTPFTELAVQQASLANAGGNITLVGFQTQVDRLENALGFSGITRGKPFGGTSIDDATHQKALTAFAKQQNSTGQTVAGALQVMGDTLDKCGPSSLAATLAVYGAAAIVTTASSGGGAVMMKAAQTAPTTLSVTAGMFSYTPEVPSPCVDALVVDTKAISFDALPVALQSGALISARSIEITSCTPLSTQDWFFPEATVVLRTTVLPQILNIQSTNAYTLLGAEPINLVASKINLAAQGCLVVAGKSFGQTSISLAASGGSLTTGTSVTPLLGSMVSSGGGFTIVTTGNALASSGSGPGLGAFSVSLPSGSAATSSSSTGSSSTVSLTLTGGKS